MRTSKPRSARWPGSSLAAWCSRPGWFAAAAVITAVVRSLLALTSGAPGWVTQVLMVVVVAILVTLNMRGVRTGARLLETITVVKLVPLLVFVGIGVFFIDTSQSRLDERAEPPAPC